MVPGPPIPGTPWFKIFKLEPQLNMAPTSVVQYLPGVTQSVVVKSKFSVNPGVLINGRRPDRPGS